MDRFTRNTMANVKNYESGNVRAQPASETKLETIEVNGEEFWPLSGKPYFHVILAKSHLRPTYQMVLPVKISKLLPAAVIPAIITYQGKNWKVTYNGEHQNKRFCGSWREFVNYFNLKGGDACVFELMENGSQILRFRVQILRGEIPSALLDRANGESINSPIVIE